MSASLLSYVFGMSASRCLDEMRAAESALVRFAMERFGGGGGAGGGNRRRHRRSMEVFDTVIPRSAVPLRDAPERRCGFPSTDSSRAERGEDGSGDGGETLTVHGVKVVAETEAGGGAASSSSSSSSPLVLLHGYANGALYFYRNLIGLARHRYGTVYALDMLGWGLSSRPPFETRDDTVRSAEDFFVESLEAWREANGVERMTLGGHSMGGYVGVAYCERYPHRVDRLILLSPAGVTHGVDDPAKRDGLPLRYRLMFGVASYLWERGTTPGSFLRALPESRGRDMVRRYVEGRLPAVSCPEERDALSDYLYANSVLPGSGEYCLNRILSPTAHAKDPTVYRIPKLDVEEVSFVYGQNDWMDPSGGIEVRRACDEIRSAGGMAPRVEVYGVRGAGHLLMLENWEEFNSALIVAGGGRAPGGAPEPRRFGRGGGDDGEFFRRMAWRRREEESERRDGEVAGADPARA